MTGSDQKSDDDRLPDKEATRRFERTVRRMVETPPKPHKPKDKTRSKDDPEQRQSRSEAELKDYLLGPPSSGWKWTLTPDHPYLRPIQPL